MSILFELFFCFFKTGLFMFGGGYAMLPILKNEVVSHKNWLTEDEMVNYFSLGQCTPGIIAVNVATFCGYKLKKTTGAIVATCGIILPSVIIILIIASMLNFLSENTYIIHAFNGIKIGVVALLIKVMTDLSKKIYLQSSNKNISFLIFFVSLTELFCFKISAVFVVLSTIIIYLFYILFKRAFQ